MAVSIPKRENFAVQKRENSGSDLKFVFVLIYRFVNEIFEQFWNFLLFQKYLFWDKTTGGLRAPGPKSTKNENPKRDLGFTIFSKIFQRLALF